MPELKSAYLFTLRVGVSQLHDVGQVPLGQRHIDLLGAGSFEGRRLKGEILPGGMDEKIFRADGAKNQNVHLVLKTGDGALIYVRYGGRRARRPGASVLAFRSLSQSGERA